MSGHYFKRGEVGPTFMRVLKALDGELKAEDISELLGLTKPVIHTTLARAVERGLAVRVSNGVYRRAE